MEALFLLMTLAVLFAVFVMPMIRRRREREELERAAAAAESATARGGAAGAPEGLSLAKEGEPGSGGLVPVDQLDVRLPGPDHELVSVLEEARRTRDWRPAGQLLALTDESELRWQRVQSLAGAAAMELSRWRAAGEPEGGHDAGWLRRWRGEQPNDPGGAQVYAQFLVWQAMADPSSADHRIILEEARTVCGEAAALRPDDPIPYITELFIARGLSYRKPDFEALWRKVTERDEQHMGAHLAALPYFSEKWHGSRADAEAFATAAAASAPEGSLLAALPLFAVYDHLPELPLGPIYQGAVVADAIEAAQFAVSHVRAGHPVEPHVRHLLLCFLVRAERYPEAAEQVRAIDGYVGAIPWVDGDDPATEYAAYRAMAIAGR
ncbi:hypothetical protein [Streptomyces radicis]|uniref:DUF4034 domain-containing protein n=1 Tax=Streptomyces radicis TaxID=1750517 RepID=A0A3A9WE25_9ACTN|nr:hypothetical protein [Streptomyces radicis]RKN07664.1 hypothetical protein D7319_18145 [Streptomyces radicis]RKN18378.1 hypothetical protein D7318_22380 [Streptomyces radicis]